MGEISHLANKSRAVYEYTLVKKLEERLEKQKRRQRLEMSKILVGFTILAGGVIAVGVLARHLVHILLFQ